MKKIKEIILNNIPEILSSILVSFLFWGSLFKYPYRYLFGNFDYDATNLFANKISFLYYHEFPFFSSYIGGGFPLWANPSNMFISIPQFFSLLINNQWLALRISIVTLSIISMLGMFTLLKQLKIDNFWCRLFGAIVYTFSGYLVSQLTVGHFWVQNMVYVPYLVSALLWSYKNNKFSYAIPVWLAIMVYAGINATSISVVIIMLSFLTFYKIKRFLIYGFLAIVLSAPKLIFSYQLLSWFPRNLDMGYVSQSWAGTLHTLITSLVWPNQTWYDTPYKYAPSLEVYLLNCYIGIFVLILAIISIIKYKKHRYPNFSISMFIVIVVALFLYPGGLNPFWKLFSKNLILGSLHMPTWFVGLLILPVTYFSTEALFNISKIFKGKTNLILIIICTFIFYDYFKVNKPNTDYIQSIFTLNNNAYFNKNEIFEHDKGPDWNLFSIQDKICFESDIMFTYLQKNEGIMQFYDGIFGYDEFGFLRHSQVKSGKLDIFNTNPDIKIEWVSPSKISVEISNIKEKQLQIPININYFPGWEVADKIPGITLNKDWTPEKWGLLTVYIDDQFTKATKQRILLKYSPYQNLKSYRKKETAETKQDEPVSAESWYKKGEELYGLYDFDNASKAFDNAIKINPNYIHAWEGKGWAMSKLKMMHEAVACFEKASILQKNDIKFKKISTKSKDAKDYFIRGASFLKESKISEAISDFNLAIKRDNNYVKAYYYRGVAYDKVHNFSNAILDFNKVIEFNPENAGAYFKRGSLYLSVGDYQNSITDFYKYVQANPRSADAHNNLGYLLYKLNRINEAEKEYRKAIKINPNLSDAHNNLGILLYNSKRIAKAEKEYRNAIKINPNFVDAHCNLGILLCDTNRIDEAEIEFKKAVTINPNLLEAHSNFGNFYYIQKKYNKALQEFETALKLSPNNQFIQEKIKLLKKL
ncbi:MAG: hypothetical protein A2539_06085 [Elusimicrobia bacterium RIFOXYD2_FULL_34_15]|nr:MAG: hypothetical protein A2539_06085 [Elusimicrobia bacterium RIFOXYD2_FULL_34_15]